MRAHIWKWFAAGGIVLVLAFIGLPDGVAAAGPYQAVELVAIGGIVLGCRLHRPQPALSWRLIIWALAGFLVLDSRILVHSFLPGAVVAVLPLGYLVGYGLYGWSLWNLVRVRDPAALRETFIDGSIVAVGLATVLLQVFIRPVLADAAGTSPFLISVSFPLLQAALSAVSVMIMFTGAARLPSAWMMFASGGFALVGNACFILQRHDGVYSLGGWVDSMWLLAYLIAGTAALHPSMRELVRPPAGGTRRNSLARLVVLGAALLSSPAAILTSTELSVGGTVAMMSSLGLTALVLWRVVRLLLERERARAELRVTAEQQAAVASFGNDALAGASTDELWAKAIAALTANLPVERVAFLELEDQELHLRARTGIPAGLELSVPAGAFPAGDLPDHPVVLKREVVPAALDAALVDATAGPIAVARINGRRHAFGLLGCQARAGARLAVSDLSFLGAVANVLAGALERRQAEWQMRHQVLHDPLTGCRTGCCSATG